MRLYPVQNAAIAEFSRFNILYIAIFAVRFTKYSTYKQTHNEVLTANAKNPLQLFWPPQILGVAIGDGLHPGTPESLPIGYGDGRGRRVCEVCGRKGLRHVWGKGRPDRREAASSSWRGRRAVSRVAGQNFGGCSGRWVRNPAGLAR